GGGAEVDAEHHVVGEQLGGGLERAGGRGGGRGLRRRGGGRFGHHPVAVGDDAVDQLLAARVEPGEAHHHAGALLLLVNLVHQAFAAHQTDAAVEHQLESDRRADGARRAGGDEDAALGDVGAV